MANGTIIQPLLGLLYIPLFHLTMLQLTKTNTCILILEGLFQSGEKYISSQRALSLIHS